MNAKNSLRLLMIEMVITATLLSMPIMTPFYHSIGMDQGQIGLSQALFTVALLATNIPTGWLADRFSRKLSNALGDVGCAVALLLYANVHSFTQVVLVEIFFGLALSFSQGADSGLLKAYTHLLDSSGKMLFRRTVLLNIWTPAAQAAALIVGGLIGAGNPRLAIALSAAPFVLGFVLSLFLTESGERLVQVHRNPIKDMVHVTKRVIVHDTHLRWLIGAYAVGREITHVMVWALTPLLVLAGVPLEIVAVGWVLNMAANIAGAQMAGRWSMRFNEWQRFLLPIIGAIVGLAVMSINLSLATIWLYALLGISQGWSQSVLLPMVQNHSPGDVQSTVVSIAKSASQLLYIPLVWAVNAVGTIDIRLTMVATIMLFAPLAIIVARRLHALSKQ